MRQRFLPLILAALSAVALAHNGPPFPIISDHYLNTCCVISLWTHPDTGIGTFFVVVDPLKGKTLPKKLDFRIGVLPVSGRLKEARYPTEREYVNGQLHFNAAIPFDQEEVWRINLYESSAEGNEGATATVMVTPPGLGAWDLLLYSLPFAGVAFLWFMAMKRRRQRTRSRQ